MRWITFLLVVALAAIIVVSFGSPESVLPGAGAHWFPAEVATGGETVDRLFDEIQWIALVLLVLTFGLLAWAVLRGGGRRSHEGSSREGSHALELAWTAAPIAVLAFLTWSQLVARAEIVEMTADGADQPPALIVDVEGAQFDWRFRYAGADGVFDTLDDVTEVVDLTVPIGRNVELRMRSVDVLHSFFVPALRMKRDLVPGAVVPLRFRIDADDYEAAGRPRSFELRCAELCGWGHYAMVGRVVPMEPDAFEAWMTERQAERFAGAPEPDESFEDDEYED